jgi:hypothetical protein
MHFKTTCNSLSTPHVWGWEGSSPSAWRACSPSGVLAELWSTHMQLGLYSGALPRESSPSSLVMFAHFSSGPGNQKNSHDPSVNIENVCYRGCVNWGCPYKQCATRPRKRCQVSWATHWQETYLAQTHFRKMESTRNYPHQTVLVTRTQVKTLHKQQTSHM